MEILLLCLCFIPALILVFTCCSIMSNNKNEDGFNIYNSSLGVQCNAKEKCDWRHSSACVSCKHNCGMKKDKVSYERK